MTAPAAWYIDPDDAEQEKYWNGAAWLEFQTRPRTAGAIAVPALSRRQRLLAADSGDEYQAALLEEAAAQTDALKQIRVYVAFLAWVVAIGIILGIVGVIVALANN